MKRLMQVFLVAVLPFIAPALAADVIPGEKIEAAFGLKLGDPVDWALVTATNAVVHGPDTVEYAFTATNTHHAFQSYTFQATPKTGKIYRITATGSGTPAELAETFDRIAAHLHEKYRGARAPEKTTGLSNIYVTAQGVPGVFERAVMLDVGSSKISVSYSDEILVRVAAAERKSIDLQKALDSSKAENLSGF